MYTYIITFVANIALACKNIIFTWRISSFSRIEHRNDVCTVINAIAISYKVTEYTATLESSKVERSVKS